MMRLDTCKHSFHDHCIGQWADRENSCPSCKARFTVLSRFRVAAGSDMLVSFEEVEARNQKTEDRIGAIHREIALDAIRCAVCHDPDNESVMLLCDGSGCEVACHTYCVGLDLVPEGDWFCVDCSPRRQQRPSRRQQLDHGPPARSAPKRLRLLNGQRKRQKKSAHAAYLRSSEATTPSLGRTWRKNMRARHEKKIDELLRYIADRGRPPPQGGDERFTDGVYMGLYWRDCMRKGRLSKEPWKRLLENEILHAAYLRFSEAAAKVGRS